MISLFTLGSFYGSNTSAANNWSKYGQTPLIRTLKEPLWRDNLLLFSYFDFADKNMKSLCRNHLFLVLTSLSRKQPVDLLSVNLFVKSLLYLVFKV